MTFSLSFSHTHALLLCLQRSAFARMGVSVWTSMGLVNALQATQDSTVSLVSMIHIILSGIPTRALMNVKKMGHCKITNISNQKFVNLTHNPFLSEVTQTPCSNSRPCPDGGPCLEYGGTYLCTCQTSGAELDHKDFYPYGKSLRHLPNNRACCSCVIV